MHKIVLQGMRFTGHHGADPNEQKRPQPFVVDVEVEGDFSEAAARDDLSLTVDYREVHTICRRTVEDQRFRLLEALSEAIAAQILRLPRVAAVTVRVKKQEARIGGPIEYRSRRDHAPSGGMSAVRAYLSLGSNVGDRLAMLLEATVRLRTTPGILVLRHSSIYETEPTGVTEQPWFLNQVLEVETTLDPPHLLEAAQQVEASLGRTREVRWGPRTIDIDVLLYENATLDSEGLRIPHPELASRRFVLAPLVELSPHLRLPDGRAVRDLLAALGETQAIRHRAE